MAPGKLMKQDGKSKKPESEASERKNINNN
jgi:hypothetical protein